MKERHRPVGSGDEPLQIKVPSSVKRQLAIVAAERGETMRAIILRALKDFGLTIEEDEISDRRKHR